jgi:uncharacterized cupredoxin-like copper-binding protein
MRPFPLLLAIALLAGCSGAGAPDSTEPDRELFVVMRDDFSYDPTEIEVTTGEIVRFRVANKGNVLHEFLIGSPEQHQEHEEQMSEGNEHRAHESALDGVSVEPGDETAFTFVVPNKTELIFGCHEPGHFAQGMKGNISYSR